ncbi:putative phosphoesterase [Acinetobacter phage XC1]|nr:putative phosphoesterase [Acinetobacter phage XC1]
MTDLNKEREVNLRFEQDDGFVWVFDGDSQFGTEISHLMMMHADEYNEDELRVICNHAACEIDRLRAELEKAKAQAVPTWISVKDEEPPTDTMVLICWSDAPDVTTEQDYMTIDEDLNSVWAHYENASNVKVDRFDSLPNVSGAEQWA